MSDGKASKRATELHETVKDSVDFKHKHIDAVSRQKKLAAARKWLRAPLEEFLRELQIDENDPEYAEIVSIWRSFHE